MSADDASEIKELLHYEDETAGAIMTTEFVSIVANQTVRSAMYVLKNEADVAETIYYIYVVNQEGQLVGVISLRDLIVNDDDAMISDLMSERVLSVHVGDDQEDVAQTFRDYDFLALPVTDYDDHLLESSQSMISSTLLMMKLLAIIQDLPGSMWKKLMKIQ